jgi:hypothetical protein
LARTQLVCIRASAMGAQTGGAVRSLRAYALSARVPVTITVTDPMSEPPVPILPTSSMRLPVYVAHPEAVHYAAASKPGTIRVR